MTPVVRHFIPAAGFLTRPVAASAEPGLAIERAQVDAGRFDCHGSGYGPVGIHFDRHMRQSLEPL